MARMATLNIFLLFCFSIAILSNYASTAPTSTSCLHPGADCNSDNMKASDMEHKEKKNEVSSETDTHAIFKRESDTTMEPMAKESKPEEMKSESNDSNSADSKQKNTNEIMMESNDQANSTMKAQEASEESANSSNMMQSDADSTAERQRKGAEESSPATSMESAPMESAMNTQPSANTSSMDGMNQMDDVMAAASMSTGHDHGKHANCTGDSHKMTEMPMASNDSPTTPQPTEGVQSDATTVSSSTMESGQDSSDEMKKESTESSMSQ